MTPTQLRAFAGVVRLGSVKAAAAELSVTEAAVSMNMRSLRNELDDPLFERSGSGLAFTPGGLRLAARAIEILGLQAQTRQEVQDAAGGKRVLRVAASSLFAEFAASGLIELFSMRANDLEVELSVVPADQLVDLVTSLGADLAIGPDQPGRPTDVEQVAFLRYELVVVCGPRHALATKTAAASDLVDQVWNLGPSAVEATGAGPELLRRIGVPESNQRIFQSHAAALDEIRQGHGVGLALGFRVADELKQNRLHRVDGRGLSAHGTWQVISVPSLRLSSAARELRRFITTPRATQAMLSGSGAGIRHFKPSVHITLWS